MIKLKVKSIWQGKCGIRDKYVFKALEEKQDLCITKDNDIMVIPFADIEGAVVAKSEFPVRDKYGKESHYLLYFNWKPTTIQGKLFGYENTG